MVEEGTRVQTIEVLDEARAARGKEWRSMVAGRVVVVLNAYECQPERIPAKPEAPRPVL